MTWKDKLDIILVVIGLGSFFNIFIGAAIKDLSRLKKRWVFVIIGILYVLEAFGMYKIMMYDKENNELQSRTAYVIQIPSGETCEGRFFSGKHSPITVECLDGRKFIAQDIQVKQKVIKDKPVW